MCSVLRCKWRSDGNPSSAAFAFSAIPLHYRIMEKEVTHLVLTRFNTAIGYAPSRMGLQTEWLTSRLALFERYCLPSVAGQQGAHFQWLVFFDAASPEWFRRKIEEFRTVFRAMYIDGIATDQVVVDSIAAADLVKTPYLLTTRLDNDDAIAKGHLATVERAFRRQEREFLVFPFGLQSFRGHLYNVYWPSNPFLSLVERVQNGDRFTTVMSVRHDLVRDAGPVKQILCSAQWLQILHDANLSNSLRGWPRLKSRSHLDFAVDWPDAAKGDNIARRVKFSVEAYSHRMQRFAGKLARLGRPA